MYCYANFYCYSIVFGPNFREGQKFSRGADCLRGVPPAPPVGESHWSIASLYIDHFSTVVDFSSEKYRGSTGRSTSRKIYSEDANNGT